MKIHQARIIPESVQRNPVSHGVHFVLLCCDHHERSVHIQKPHKYTPEELQRKIQDMLDTHAEEHAALEAAEEAVKLLCGAGMKGDCGCGK